MSRVTRAAMAILAHWAARWLATYPILPRQVWRYRRVLAGLVTRDFLTRTQSTLLGVSWLVLQPALQVLAIWFLFSVILGIHATGRGRFIDYFLLGFIVWNMGNEALVRGASVFREFASLYQRSLFPLSILPLVPITEAAIVHLPVFVLTMMFLHGPQAAPAALAYFAIFALWLVPLVILVALMGHYIREVTQVLPFVMTFLMYVSPILYTPEQVPESMRWLISLNPLADLVALGHWAVEGAALGFETPIRLMLGWLMLMPVATVLFRRLEPHLREL